MNFKIVVDNKKQFLDLLLLADEQEDMINKYLDRGDLFALYDGDLKSICVVTCEDDGIYELKNIATYNKYQGQGYGKKLVEYIFEYYKGKCKTMFVGTGDSPFTISFYKHCGFVISHRVNNFFTDNYDHPIFECNKQLVDMIYLKKDF
ncbi:GNAT family N-acetyltransferase [Methanosarcina siciliae]|uniref:GNAT family N-acetyltransferase n=1 Tax=Methanosarcina siciliae TaxID=38027 RepID=UPI00064F1E27|nr:GNAT family N-acetyltransferase [Methanosarcina siciliae]